MSPPPHVCPQTFYSDEYFERIESVRIQQEVGTELVGSRAKFGRNLASVKQDPMENQRELEKVRIKSFPENSWKLIKLAGKLTKITGRRRGRYVVRTLANSRLPKLDELK